MVAKYFSRTFRSLKCYESLATGHHACSPTGPSQPNLHWCPFTEAKMFGQN